MTWPAVADGEPLRGDLIAVLDESSPANAAGGVTFVVTTVVLIDPAPVSSQLAAMFPPDRSRPFHWATEGVAARRRMVEIVAQSGVVAMSYYAHVGRRQQTHARAGMLARAAEWLAAEGVTHLVVEAGDTTTNSRDRHTLLEVFRDRGGVPFHYDHRSKAEPLLWLPDAIAGAAGQYLTGTEPHWYGMFEALGSVSLVSHT